MEAFIRHYRDRKMIMRDQEEKRVQLHALVPMTLKRKLQHIALDRGQSLSELVTAAMQRYAADHNE